MRLVWLLSIFLTCACAVSDGSRHDPQHSHIEKRSQAEYETPIIVEGGGLRGTAQHLQRLQSRLDSLLLSKASFLEVHATSKNAGGGNDEDSNPIYLLPADPNYSPTGPNGFFPNNWFNPLTTSNTVGILPPAPAAATGPDVGGAGGPGADGGGAAVAEDAAAAAPPAPAEPAPSPAFRALTYTGGLLSPGEGPLKYNPLTFDAV